MKKTIFILATLMAGLGCNQQKTDAKAEGEKLMQTSRDMAQAALTKDVEKTLGYWADDAVLISAGQPALNGKKEIRQMVEASFKTPGFKISWEPLRADVSASGDMAYLVEKSQITFTDSTGKSITTHSNAVTVWKKQADGSWKNVADISANEPQ
ncbi:MAG TPA: SgcJ/EcaC family oxidoreductase [Puia sp.]|nr:SgcJ/EcaC family oxidoreductase [Puia sp.]